MLKNKILSKSIPFLPQVSLIISNLIPLFGVIFFGWQVSTLLALYWAESGVVGFYTILKMMKSEKQVSNLKKAEGKLEKEKLNKIKEKLNQYGIFIKIFLSIFFIFHFGIFMIVHGVFLGVFFREFAGFGQVSFLGIIISLVGLLISHGISYYKNYIQKEEYKKYTPKELMGMPYHRIIIMQFVIILTGFAAAFIGNYRMSALIILIVVKVFFDLNAHIKEHSNKKASQSKQGG